MKFESSNYLNVHVNFTEFWDHTQNLEYMLDKNILFIPSFNFMVKKESYILLGHNRL